MLHLIILLLHIFPWETTGIPIEKVYTKCKQNPSIPSCTGRLLGPLPTPTDTQNTALKVYSDDETNTDFMKWLTEFKDEPARDENKEGSETAVQFHSDVELYCVKYKRNFNKYCSSKKSKQLEGVLSQFCSTYEKSCGKGEVSDKQEMKEDTRKQEKIFQGETSTYCTKFASTYEKLCKVEIVPNSEEFCNSFKENCESGGKVTDMKEDSLAEFPSELENEKTEKVEGEGAEKLSDEVVLYCSKYLENYNFFCAGGYAAKHLQFCQSYEQNCPQNVETWVKRFIQ